MSRLRGEPESYRSSRYIPDPAPFVRDFYYERRVVEEPSMVNLLVGSIVVPSRLVWDELEQTDKAAITETDERGDDVRRVNVFPECLSERVLPTSN